MKPIFLFDIDGTLLRVKRTFLIEVIGTLLEEVGIDKNKLKGKTFAGRTDKDIFSEIIHQSPLDEGAFDHLKSLYIRRMDQNLSADQIELMPGAQEAINYAHEHHYELGLCTGNFKEVAFKKVEAAGFAGMFNFGGYGCNHTDRKHLPEEAHKSYIKHNGDKPEPNQYVVIGDTPNDVSCAKYFGARSVAVTTGGFSEQELIAYKPDFILPGLRNPKAWIPRLLVTRTSQK